MINIILRGLKEEDVDALLERLGEKVVGDMAEDELEALTKLAEKMGDFAPSMRELLGYALAYRMFDTGGKKEDSWDKILPLLLQQQQQSTNLLIALLTQQQQTMMQMMSLLLGQNKGEDWIKMMNLQQNMLNTIISNIQTMQSQYNRLLFETEKKERKKEIEDLKKTIAEIEKKFDEKMQSVLAEIGRLQYMEDQYQRYRRGEPIEVALEQLRKYEEFRKRMMEYAEELGMKKVPVTPEGRIDWGKAAFELLKRGFSVLEKYVEAQPKIVRELPITQQAPTQPRALVIPRSETEERRAIVIPKQETTPTQEKIEKAMEEMFSGVGETGGESEESPTTESEESEEGGSEESSGEE